MTVAPAMVPAAHRAWGERAKAKIEPLDGQRARVVFDERVRAVALGQAAVFYDGDVVLGGGWIARASA